MRLCGRKSRVGMWVFVAFFCFLLDIFLESFSVSQCTEPLLDRVG